MTSFKVALRQLVQSPGFTVIAVLTLALGIGLSTSSFSMANTFLLRNVPYPAADRLVRVFTTSSQTQTGGHAPGNLIDLRETATSFEDFAIFSGDALALGAPGQPAEQVSGMAVTADFFDVIGVQPVLGRGFVPGEDAPDQAPVAILTHRSWMRRYGGDPAVLDRDVRLNAEPYKIIGVLPPTFEAPLVWGPVDFITVRTLYPTFRTNRSDSWMHGVARLKPGVSLHQAQSELSILAARLTQEYPKENATLGLRVIDLHKSNMDNVSRSLLWLMTGLSLAMLLIACANLASLQVARAFGRSREFAVRAALGGSRRQLMVPLLTESIVLAVLGGVLSLVVAHWSNAIIGSMLMINGEPGFDIAFDRRVFLFAASSSLISGIAFGLMPAWLASRSPAAAALKEGSRSSTATRSHQRLKRALIICELAVALALVGGAAAFGLGARSILDRESGWDMNGVFTGFLPMPYNRYSDDDRNRQFQRAVLDRLAALPGVEHAALATSLPIFSLGGPARLSIEGRPADERGHEPLTELAAVSPAYFSALRIPLRQGRLFSANDAEDSPAVAVINEAFAARFWPGENALGRRVRIGDSEKWTEIIGVVPNLRMSARLDAPETRLQMYRPLLQAPGRYLSLAVRSSLPPETLARSVGEAVAAVDPDLPVSGPGSVRAILKRNLGNLNLVIVNLGISAGMGLLIAAVGLFGVISQLTLQRTRDIGVRMALGAQARDILRMILGEGVVLFLIGMVIGVPAFLWLTRFLHRTLPEMQLPGWWLLAANLGVLAVTTLIACALPAFRATRVNPVVALRSD